MTANKDESKMINGLLSELTDHDANIYEMTRDLARIAKQIKADSKEESEPVKPVIEAIKKMFGVGA